MNFFEQQELARRQTRKLVVLFILAVIAIVVMVNLAAALAWSWTATGQVLGMQDYPRGFFVTNTLIVLALIGGGSAIEMFNLREGGDAVARMVGGRLVSPSTTERDERRLLNVVEEMALASGLACPRVYILDKEQSINAFAAGYNQDQAVVAVTRGTLERLTRDELQGVVAHEFSHILNGDMRLNIRLIGLLFGIQMLASFGRHLLEFMRHTGPSRGRDDRGGQLRMVLALTGVAMIVVGSIGVFFGRLIKSAVSRQREYLADASAVQFTRNPDGIGGALRKIGGLSRGMRPGSRIAHPNAEQLSHLFLGAPRPSLLSGWLATHPPIEERLHRIFGRKVGVLDAPVLAPELPATSDLPPIPYTSAGFASSSVPAETEAGSLSRSGADLAYPGTRVTTEALPHALQSASREPFGASALVCALLLDEREHEREMQLAVLMRHMPALGQLAGTLAASLQGLPRSTRLPLLDRAMPALLLLSPVQRTQLLSTVAALIAADKRCTLAEFVIETVLARRLDPRAGRPVPVRYASLSALRAETALLLSLVAHASAVQPATGPEKLFVAGAARVPELGLHASDLQAAHALDFPAIRIALEQAHQLAPLAKPRLVKALLAAASDDGALLQVTAADLLRAICAAIESPIPPAVAQTYTDQHW